MKVYECIDLNKYLNEFGQEEAIKILIEKFGHSDSGFVEIGGENNG